MNKEQVIEKLSALLPNVQISSGIKCAEMIVDRNELIQTIELLKFSADLDFDYLVNLMGVDFDNQLGIFYHLESYALKHELIVKCFAEGRDNAVLPTIVKLYPEAELLEREVFELYGITIEGHPDLRKLLLPDDWEGYPLRKDYSDPVNIVER